MKQVNLEDDIDALFKVPLTEFISARKTLAARLKKEGHADQANRAKALVKPSISAWTVNQLYWQHREAFDRLLSAGQNVRRAQSSRIAGKTADLRGPLDARQKALSELSNLATALLGAAGSNPNPDMVRRVTTTLEAMSAYASLPDDLAPGRLTHDIDPPGFESFASSFSGAAMPARTAQPARAVPSRKDTAATQKAAPKVDARQIEKTRQAKLATAKASQQEARSVLGKARTTAQSAKAAQKKAEAEAKLKEKQRREAEERLKKATAASEAAARRAQSAAAEAEEAANAVKSAEQLLQVMTEELESIA